MFILGDKLLTIEAPFIVTSLQLFCISRRLKLPIPTCGNWMSNSSMCFFIKRWPYFNKIFFLVVKCFCGWHGVFNKKLHNNYILPREELYLYHTKIYRNIYIQVKRNKSFVLALPVISIWLTNSEGIHFEGKHSEGIETSYFPHCSCKREFFFCLLNFPHAYDM